MPVDVISDKDLVVSRPHALCESADGLDCHGRVVQAWSSCGAGEADDGDEVGEPRFRHQALAADVTQLLMRTAATCLTVSDKMLALGTAGGSVHLLDYGGNEVRNTDHMTKICLFLCVLMTALVCSARIEFDLQTSAHLLQTVCRSSPIMQCTGSRACTARHHACVASNGSVLPSMPLSCTIWGLVQVKRYDAHCSRVNDLCFDDPAEHVASCSDDGSVVVRTELQCPSIRVMCALHVCKALVSTAAENMSEKCANIGDKAELPHVRSMPRSAGDRAVHR